MTLMQSKHFLIVPCLLCSFPLMGEALESETVSFKAEAGYHGQQKGPVFGLILPKNDSSAHRMRYSYWTEKKGGPDVKEHVTNEISYGLEQSKDGFLFSYGIAMQQSKELATENIDLGNDARGPVQYNAEAVVEATTIGLDATFGNEFVLNNQWMFAVDWISAYLPLTKQVRFSDGSGYFEEDRSSFETYYSNPQIAVLTLSLRARF